MNLSYDLSLSLLGLKPAEFWTLTPAETADLLLAYRKRENRRLIQETWKLHLQIVDKVDEKDRHTVSPAALFKAIPGSYPDEVKGLEQAIAEHESPERSRRRNVKRIQQRPR